MINLIEETFNIGIIGDKMSVLIRNLNDLVKEMIQLRKNLEWTQTEFAKKCGKSQSLIAKIERDWGKDNKRNKIQPSYNTIKDMYNTLLREFYKRNTEKKAKDIMNSNIVFVYIDDKVEKAVVKMKENNFSQLPVKDKDIFVGSITSNDLLGVSPKTKIKDIMGPAFLIVDINMPISLLKKVMRKLDRKAVLVKDEETNEIVGIITPHDLI